MLFSSLIFSFYFFPVFVLFYFISGMRTAVLLVGSVFFYVWGEGAYIVLLMTLIGMNFLIALWLDRRVARLRLFALMTAVLINLFVLAVFKYSDFIVLNLNLIFPGARLDAPGLKLPLGISFFTFQLVSYLVDVNRGRVPVEKSIWRFSAYILMFPHLIAGPIVRYGEIRNELAGRRVDLQRFGLGVQYFIVGLSQKVLVANSVASLADYAFSLKIESLSMLTAWLGAISYTIQIYFDFCGYSNMAIGLAFMLGFTFPKNFDYPYSAVSMTDFWRRWHISLSFWFRDYVYIPLGGSKGGSWKTYRNLLVVFFLTGLWHGAAWNFVAWGLFHGAFLLAERAWLGKSIKRLPLLVRSCYVFAVVLTGWVLFRADNLRHGVDYLKVMWLQGPVVQPDIGLNILLTPEVITALAFGAVLSFPVVPYALDRMGFKKIDHPTLAMELRLNTWSVHRLPIFFLLIGFLFSCALLAGSTLNPFLYFRF